ncbi:MAG: hypothetical protein GY898_13705 [Proteobacteria bacterium]|nr:hypothetical protein [Pseudomonadota bacterium]
MACARCGTFVCTGCIVSGDICVQCKSLLFREGVPWSDAEKARKAARDCIRRGRWAVRLLFSFGAAAVLLIIGAAGGALPTQAAAAGSILGGFSAGFGLAAMGFAGWGFRRSRQGRPGSAVEGVFPGAAALMMAGMGAAPVALMAFRLAKQLQLG